MSLSFSFFLLLVGRQCRHFHRSSCLFFGAFHMCGVVVEKSQQIFTQIIGFFMYIENQMYHLVFIFGLQGEVINMYFLLLLLYTIQNAHIHTIPRSQRTRTVFPLVFTDLGGLLIYWCALVFVPLHFLPFECESEYVSMCISEFVFRGM